MASITNGGGERLTPLELAELAKRTKDTWEAGATNPSPSALLQHARDLFLRTFKSGSRVVHRKQWDAILQLEIDRIYYIQTKSAKWSALSNAQQIEVAKTMWARACSKAGKPLNAPSILHEYAPSLLSTSLAQQQEIEERDRQIEELVKALDDMCEHAWGLLHEYDPDSQHWPKTRACRDRALALIAKHEGAK